MLKCIRNLSITTILILLSFASRAQEDIGFISTAISSGNVTIGNNISVYTKLKNYDSQTFHDTIAFSLAVNGTIVPGGTICPNPVQGQVLNIPTGDSLALTFTIAAQGPYFVSGPNGLIIWPIFEDSSKAHDSIFFQIDAHPLGIRESEKEGSAIKLSNGLLRIYALSEVPEHSTVRIYNSIGSLILKQSNSLPIEIPVYQWSTGVYFIEIESRGDPPQVFKFTRL
jgi:hypothetical protein